MEENKIILTTDEGDEIEMNLIESTVLNGTSYILVTEAEDEDENGICYLMKDVSEPGDEEAVYVSVDDDAESDAAYAVFRQLLEGEYDLEG